MRSLEAIGVLEKDDNKGGRRITQSGQRDLDRKFIWILVPKMEESSSIVCGAGASPTNRFGIGFEHALMRISRYCVVNDPSGG